VRAELPRDQKFRRHLLTTIIVKRHAVQRADGNEKKRQEEKNDYERSAEDVAGAAAVAEGGLNDQDESEEGAGRGSRKGAGQNQPMRTSASLRPHKSSDKKCKVGGIIPKWDGSTRRDFNLLTYF